MRAWVAGVGRVNFQEPSTLWILGRPGSDLSGPWRSEGLTLAQAIQEALASEPDLHPLIRVTTPSFSEPLDFEHLRALHGHLDYRGLAPVGPERWPSAHKSRVAIEIETTDE